MGPGQEEATGNIAGARVGEGGRGRAYQCEYHAGTDEGAPDDGHGEVQPGLQGPSVEK